MRFLFKTLRSPLLFLLVVGVLFFCAFLSPRARAAGGAFQGVISRDQWWPAEAPFAKDYVTKTVKYKKRGRTCYSKKRSCVTAPRKDIEGYCQRRGGGNHAKVPGYAAIVWHHTDGSQSPNLVDMALFHRRKGFCDLAYHFVIKRNKDGRWAVYEGTPLGYIGSHAARFNAPREMAGLGTVGIAVAGDYGRQSPDAELRKVMTALQDRVVRRYRIKRILTHRDGPLAVNDGRDCPGKNMVPFINELARRAR
jgi:hypothetical protein